MRVQVDGRNILQDTIGVGKRVSETVMLEWLGTLFGISKSVLSGAKSGYESHEAHKRELLHDFVLEAIGLRECLSPDNDEPGSVSFNTIEIRMRLLQQAEPERATHCGVPALTDTERLTKIREILKEMVLTHKLKRCRRADTWSVR